jgi:hypothetical protein
MPSLFSLFVDLKANTADFVSGMSTASYAAKKAGRDIEESFSSLGNIASVALAPFGELGAVIGESLGKIGEYAASASGGFAKLGGGMSAVAVGGGVAVGAMAAVGAGAIGVALHVAESAAKLHELSQSTGVSVEALSGFSFVAKQTGVDTQVMTTGLERLSKSAAAAAAAPAGAVNAYSRLGISVRDSGGNIRSVESIFEDVADRFAKMPDGVTKSALAMQIFGRSGAELIPILNSGRAGIEAYLATAQKLGVVPDSQTAEAAHQFEQSLATLEAAAQGVGLQLTKDMLPALQAITGAMVELAEGANKGTGPVAAIADSFKYFLQIADFVYTELELVTSWLAKTAVAWEVFGEGAAAAAGKLAHLDFSGVSAVWKDTFAQLDAIQADYIARGKQNWQNYQEFVGKVFSKPQPAAPESGAKPTDLGVKQPAIAGIASTDVVADLVTKLAAQASAELSLAGAIQQSVAAMTLAKAAGEADVKIAETRTQLLDREKTLREQLAGAQKGAHPEEAGKFTAEIAAVEVYLAELDQAAPQIRERYIEIAAAKLAVSANQELGKETLKFDSQIASLNQVAAAYKQGGAAIAAADIGKQLEGDREKVAELAEAYAILAATEPENITALAQLGSGLLQANAALDAHAKALQQIRSLSISEQIAKDTRAFQDQIPALQQLAAAYGQGADAVRAAEVSLKVADFQAKNPGASADQIAQIKALYQQQSNVGHAGAIAQEAAQYNLNQSLADELEKLNQIREVMQANGASTLAVDAAIYEAQQKSLEQWDAAALKVGTLTDKYKAFLNEIQIAGQDLGGKIFSSFSKAVDDISTQLAKLVVTGKSNFHELWQSLEESIVKAGIQSAFGHIAGAFGGGQLPGSSPNAPGGTGGTLPGGLGLAGGIAGIFGIKMPGLGGGSGSANGTQASPFYTIPMDASGNVLQNLTGKQVGSMSAIGNLFGPNSSGGASSSSSSSSSGFGGLAASMGNSLKSSFSSIFSSITSTISELGKSIGNMVHGIGGLFGGFLAGGGDVTNSKAYIVGENHPEVFLPRQAGRVVPSLSGSRGGGTVNNHIYINGVTDFDSFQRSSAQIMAGIHRQTQIALARNG